MYETVLERYTFFSFGQLYANFEPIDVTPSSNVTVCNSGQSVAAPHSEPAVTVPGTVKFVIAVLDKSRLPSLCIPGPMVTDFTDSLANFVPSANVLSYHGMYALTIASVPLGVSNVIKPL